ncbi:TatD family hydrolase [Synechococcus sp. PCC 6312]|uniref:TatD family hydrolase n=1 Tax=Synechococcus sp. (strain ATCC 27167 / PCC 6312) TaxID=195253 RepID=UPI00029F31DE|nr:TatD family hydrolase [Synechococcus sp. PCC 6312]AFY61440.1 Sec-independent protein translocase TatD [Synechococcus sp. PCC 6312]
MLPPLVDTHVHLNFDVFTPDLAEIAQHWRDAGVVALVHSCVEPSEFTAIQAIAQQFPEVYFAVGLHPLDAAQWQPDYQSHIHELARSDSKVVAIGEMGLDFFKADNIETQTRVFWSQLEIAQALDLPVIIHCRDAAATMRDLLEKFWQTQGAVRGVMHCWGGTPEETQWFLDLGFYISFSGTVTFKNAHGIKAAAQIVPVDRLLIETDCPFLAPVPKRGEKRNEPSYVQYVAQHVSELRNISVMDLGQQTTQNAAKLFGLAIREQIYV